MTVMYLSITTNPPFRYQLLITVEAEHEGANGNYTFFAQFCSEPKTSLKKQRFQKLFYLKTDGHLGKQSYQPEHYVSSTEERTGIVSEVISKCPKFLEINFNFYIFMVKLESRRERTSILGRRRDEETEHRGF